MSSTPNAAMGDDDIRAFSMPWPGPGSASGAPFGASFGASSSGSAGASSSARTPPAARRRRWPGMLALGLGLVLLTAFALAALLMGLAENLRELIANAAHQGQITINGHAWQVPEITGEWLGWALLAVVAACVLALLLVPLALLAAMLAVVVGVCGALLGLAVAVAVATAPLWIVGLVLWLILRKPSHRTIAAT